MRNSTLFGVIGIARICINAQDSSMYFYINKISCLVRMAEGLCIVQALLTPSKYFFK